jgi:hypothetical protein
MTNSPVAGSACVSSKVSPLSSSATLAPGSDRPAITTSPFGMILAMSTRSPDDACDSALASRAVALGDEDGARSSSVVGVVGLAIVAGGRRLSGGRGRGIWTSHKPAKAVAPIAAPPDIVADPHTPDFPIISTPAKLYRAKHHAKHKEAWGNLVPYGAIQFYAPKPPSRFGRRLDKVDERPERRGQ